MGESGRAINNININCNATLTITSTDSKLTTSGANNDTDDKFDICALGAAIKDMDVGSTASGFNNDTEFNKFDTSMLDMSSAAIKDTNIKPTGGEANNNTDEEVDTDMFIGGVISKTDVEFTMVGLGRANTIDGKEVCKSNLFQLLLTSNRSLVPKELLSRPLPSTQLSILMNYYSR